MSAAPDQAAARDYRPIARLFPRPLPPARPADPAIPAAVAAPPTPPVRQAPVLSLRYMGSSVDENGARTYYIRNETTGRRLNVGEGRNDDGIEFVGERDGAIVLRIDGFEYTVRK
ncbi:MAG TPA: hypothetical protein DD477_13465 [Spirochaetaceae bacterium]|nr:hypothetical protein [Spirochaetaceae bacterium]HAW85478.1 hypothetical protein [Spirochaetaceae bacterium]HAX37568.1 hypothetical protein [Spirochaetaceae bacterium]HBO42201.1 hypothetical protein [Spirochaetaceae bacterium]HCQ86146.1 hypothetical protein [Spirochaetaceae bacterium]